MIDKIDLELERSATEEARDQRNDAVFALREIYSIRGEDNEIAEICNRVLSQGWVDLV